MNISPAKRWSAITILVFTLTLACGLCLIALTPKVYVATAQIAVMARGPIDQLGFYDDSGPPLDDHTARTEIEIQTDAMLEPIVADLELDKKWAKRFPADAPVAHLRSHLKLELKAGTNVIRISFFSDVPIEAANIANAILDGYKIMRDEQFYRRPDRGENALRSQIADQEKVVAQKQAEVNLAGKGISLPPDIAQLMELRKGLLEAQEDHDARQVLVDRVNKMRDGETYDFLGSFSRSYTVSPWMRSAMKHDCDMAQSRVDELRKRIDAAKTRLDQDPSIKSYRDVLRDLEQQQSILDALNVRLRQVTADTRLLESPVRILARAEAPSHPIQPNVPLDLLCSAFAGLLLGITVASFVELLLWLRR